MRLKMRLPPKGGERAGEAENGVIASEIPEGVNPRMGAGWLRTAERSALEGYQRLKENFQQGVRDGVIPIEIPTDRIEDEVGSDRMNAWRSGDAFEALVQDIQRRGQRQPIRVRPVDTAWLPFHEDPTDIGDMRFVLQSGRRRLEACRVLGRPVRAILSYPEGQALVADLWERFLENDMRQNLSPFERFVSIGEIALHNQDMTQTELAARLGVQQPDISLGRRVYERRLTLQERFGGAVDLSRDALRSAVRTLDEARAAGDAAETGRSAPRPRRKPARQPWVREFPRARVSVERKNDRTVKIVVTGFNGTLPDEDEIARVVAERFDLGVGDDGVP